MCFRTRGIVLCKSRDVKIAQDAVGGYNTGGREKGGVCGKKGSIYSSSSDFLVQLMRYANFDSYPVFCWLTNTKRPSLHLAQLPGTSWTTILKRRLSTCCKDTVQCRALLLHHTPLLPLRPCTSWSKPSSSPVVPTVQASNMSTNMPSGRKSTGYWCHRIENTSWFALGCF